jgi:hypothetical protein
MQPIYQFQQLSSNQIIFWLLESKCVTQQGLVAREQVTAEHEHHACFL